MFFFFFFGGGGELISPLDIDSRIRESSQTLVKKASGSFWTMKMTVVFRLHVLSQYVYTIDIQYNHMYIYVHIYIYIHNISGIQRLVKQDHVHQDANFFLKKQCSSRCPEAKQGPLSARKLRSLKQVFTVHVGRSG